MTGFNDHGDEPSASIITQFLDRWNNYRIIKKIICNYIHLEDDTVSILLLIAITNLCVPTVGPEE
jgi:hypothetical protein